MRSQYILYICAIPRLHFRAIMNIFIHVNRLRSKHRSTGDRSENCAHICAKAGCVRRSRTPSMVLRSVVLLTTLGVRLLHVLRHIARSSQGGERIRKPRSRYSGPVYIFKCYTMYTGTIYGQASISQHIDRSSHMC